MTREEAIKYFKRHLDLYCVDGISREAEEMAIQALSQEPTYYPPCIDCNKKMDEIRRAYDKLKEQEPCDDVISREAVLEICNEEWDSDLLVERIEHLPSVTQKSGKWILTIEDWNKWTCSNCGYVKRTDIHVNIGWKFCPNCGAKMESEEEE